MTKEGCCRTVLSIFLVLLVSMYVAGCNDDECPTCPPCDQTNPHNVLLVGPWLFSMDSYPANFYVFDGQGNVIDGGGHNPQSPFGTYSMNADSSGTVRVNYDHDNEIVFSVKLTSGTRGTATGMVDGEERQGEMDKVLNIGAMAGTWAGEIDVLSQVRVCTLHVDESGMVTGFDGFPSPATGRAYADPSGAAIAMVRTAAIGAFHEFFFHTGSVTNNMWSGSLSVDHPDGDGTFSFVRN